jgi:hypothetical protein
MLTSATIRINQIRWLIFILRNNFIDNLSRAPWPFGFLSSTYMAMHIFLLCRPSNRKPERYFVGGTDVNLTLFGQVFKRLNRFIGGAYQRVLRKHGLAASA